ncbi:MAG: enoyl-CoA hydratase, partial [Deltaproteobacteria bacterium]
MSELSITDRGPVRIVVIDGEARMNVLSRALVAELAAESKRAGGDSAIRAMVITGSGTRAFCAGANLKERRGWTDDDIRRWLVE